MKKNNTTKQNKHNTHLHTDCLPFIYRLSEHSSSSTIFVIIIIIIITKQDVLSSSLITITSNYAKRKT